MYYGTFRSKHFNKYIELKKMFKINDMGSQTGFKKWQNHIYKGHQKS